MFIFIVSFTLGKMNDQESGGESQNPKYPNEKMAVGTLHGFSCYQRVHAWVCCDFVNMSFLNSWKIYYSQCQFHLVRKKIIARHPHHGLEGTTCITYNAKISSLIKTQRTFHTEGMSTTQFRRVPELIQNHWSLANYKVFSTRI